MATLRLSKNVIDDVVRLSSIDGHALARLLAAFEDLGPTIKRSKIRELITRHVGSASAGPLERFLFGLNASNRREGSTFSDLLDGIENAIIPSRLKGEEADQWRRNRELLERLLRSSAVTISAKALDLSYDFARLFVGARIITDMRPVFDDLRNEIIGTSITQTLRLDYRTSDGTDSTISVSLDISDLRELMNSCQSAIDKATVARRLIEDGCKKEAILAGEDLDE
jgi:hypothetical protein